MTIKVQCSCETRFAFEVEPVNGRMPVRVNCPNCGADGTESANAMIAQLLAAAGEGTARIRISGAVPGTSAATPTPTTPTSTPDSDASRTPDSTAVEHCPKHRQEIAVEHCYVCGKPICAKCMEQFGYLCSVYCQSQAQQRNIPIPVFAGQKFVAQAREWRTVKFALIGIAAVAVLSLGVYLWFITVGSKPRTLYSIATAKTDWPVISHLISASEMLLLRANKLALIDVESGKEQWSATLGPARPSSASPQRQSVFDADEEPPALQMQVSGDDIWISTSDRVARYDLKTGKLKSEVPVSGSIREIEFGSTSILLVSEDPAKQKTVTRVELPSGAVRSEAVTTGLSPKSASTRAIQRPAPVRPSGGGDDIAAYDLAGSREFLAAGVNVVQFQSKLLEKRLLAVQAIKPTGSSSLSSDKLTARDSLKASIEELNNMQREQTGGVSYENESRYQVTLRRLAPADAPDWTGEVVGLPEIFPQKTVDALIAGKTIHVFSKKNQKLWEGKLTFAISDRFSLGDSGGKANSPCVEDGGSLYVFDKGTLNAFDLRTGNVRWRVPSVGISQVVRDYRGMLYVVTTSAGPESIQYSQQIRIADKPYPVVLKVDPASGKVLWRSEKLGEECFVSDKYVYVTRAQVSGIDVVRAGGDGGGVPVHFRIYRLNPGSGDYIWEFYDQQAPKHVEVQKNRLLLQYPGEIRVLTFRSL